MFSGLQSVKFVFDRCPKRQNNSTSKYLVHVFSIEIANKSQNALLVFALVVSYFCFIFTVLFWAGRLWKLNSSGNPNEPKDWLQRDMWLAQQGCFTAQNRAKLGPRAKIKPKLGQKRLRHMLVMFGQFSWKVCGKDTPKSEVALFCFLGHRSNPNLTDWSPETIALHDFCIFGARRNPYVWIWIYQITLKDLRINKTILGNNVLGHWNLEIWRFWNLGILQSWKFQILKWWQFWIRNFETLKLWNLGILNWRNFETFDDTWYL